MQHVKQYVKENKKELYQIFDSMAADSFIEATKVYSFLQSAFDTQEFKFLQNGKSFFTEEDNSDKMQALIEEYYLSMNAGEGKFYMYRVTFEFNEVLEIIKFWLNKNPSIKVMYKDSQQPIIKQPLLQEMKKPDSQARIPSQAQTESKQTQMQQKQDNEFLPDQSSIPAIISAYRQQIQKYLQRIKSQQLNEGEIKNYKDKITELQTKIAFLEERLRLKSLNKKQDQNIKKTKNQQVEQISPLSPKRQPKQTSPAKVESTLKAIFEFYAKQLHVTGVKASFQRIEHQSNRINYQKLVHFLKEYNIFPQQSKDQKKLHHFYVKSSSNTRDLTYTGFMSLLERLSQVVIPSQGQGKSKFQTLKQNIIDQRRKNKVLNNPFHSLQKEDFRIDKSTLKYQFKLMPLNGKDPEQVTHQLQARRQLKQQKKSQRQQQQQQKKLRYIRKLQSIDPFHPIVQKNRHLIRQRSVMQSQPVVSMDNIQMFRDKSFDLRSLGIEDEVVSSRSQSPMKYNVSSNRSYLIRNRAREIQKLQVDKMRNLMSGIIERSNAKLQKLGLSPTKRSNMF